jgi:hypothetical protein
MSTLLLLPFLSGCVADPAFSGGASPADPPGTVRRPAFDRHPLVTIESAPGSLADPTAVLFSNDWVHQVDIELTHQAAAGLFADPYTYVSGAVTYDGTTLSGVGVRLKGKLGSFRDLNGKAGFKIDFKQMGGTATLFGQSQIELNNNVQDCSSLKTVIGYHVFELAGSPGPRAAFAWVKVNGVDYGLYNVIDPPNQDWLARHYADHSGNLYDGKYVYYGAGGYTLLDFQADLDGLFQLEEGTDVAHVDIDGVTRAIWENWSGPNYAAATAAVVDWTETHGYLAAEQMTGHVDGYSLNENNYRFYFDPADGKADFIPWDLDNAFTPEAWWGKNWAYPPGHLTASCWDDPGCYADQAVAVGDLIAAMSTVDWQDEIDRYDMLTAPYIDADPRKECSTWESSRDDLRDWMNDEPATVAAFWGL